MTKPHMSLLVGIALLLAAFAASSAVAVLTLSAQTTDPGLEFTDNNGQQLDQVVLPGPGNSVLVQVHFTGVIGPTVNAVQISITFDDSIVSVTAPGSSEPPLCDGAFAGAFAGSGRVRGESASWFFCGITSTVGVPSTGHIMNLQIEQLTAGVLTLDFRTDGILATKMFGLGVSESESVITQNFVTFSSLNVLAPTPTPTPVPTTPPGSGGGGGGAAPQPAPTQGPVIVVPGVPQNVIVTPIVGGVTLAWDAPQTNGGAAITSYRVLVIPIARAISVAAPQTQTTITGLDPDQSYQFQVNALNTVGPGQGSVLTAPVSPLRPLSAPQGVTATVRSDNASATVSWQAPAATGSGAVTGYTVISDPAVGNGVSIGPTLRSVTFPGLAFDTSYSFRVRARNAAGEGPLSGPSNAVVTGGPVSGSPGDIPGTSPKPSVDASEEELTEFEQAVSSAFGSQIKLNRGTPSIKSVEGGLMVEFDAEPNGAASSASGSIKSKVGKLELDIANGSGTAELSIDEHVSIRGAARLVTGANTVQVQIDSPELLFVPVSPPAFAGGGGSVTQVGADFGVAMKNLPESVGLTARFIDNLDEVPDAVTSFQLAAGGSGGDIEDPATDIAFVVVVDKQGITNDDLGDNAVTLSVSRTWYEGRLANGKQIFITKIGDDGVAHTAAATCEVAGDIARCRVVFTGAAGGFSLFGVVAQRPRAAVSTVEPTATTAPATATPTASPVPSPTATAVPVATATRVAVQPTVTPLSALQPSPEPPEQVDPDASDGGGGGFPLWASLLIGFAGLAVLVPAGVAGYGIYRRKQAV